MDTCRLLCSLVSQETIGDKMLVFLILHAPDMIQEHGMKLNEMN